MREIKFRIWDETNKIMVYPDEYGRYQFIVNDREVRKVNEPVRMIMGQHWCLNPMQFTGLLDKNKKQVYEGDIMMDKYEDKMEDDPIVKIYHPVVFKDGCFGWIGENSGQFHNFHDDPIGDRVVVGNIWENPELLTKK